MQGRKHTKGHWRVTRHNGLPHAIVADDEGMGSVPIATIHLANDHEANAALMAAAPDLLEALEDAANRLRGAGMLSATDEILAVISIATGAREAD
jgi:hypothetical protein